jgi:prepilin-type N-terminal cleavage/methylation domain-containing protein
MSAASRRGFTLIEVLIALVIGSLVVLLTHQLFVSVIEGTQHLEIARNRLESERLGIRWLESAMLSVEAGGPAGIFEGHPERMEFTTWLLQPGGWMEENQIELVVKDSILVACVHGEVLALRRDVQRAELDYLLEPGAESQWVREWVSPVSAPLAVRLRLTRGRAVDTLLLLIKGRG